MTPPPRESSSPTIIEAIPPDCKRRDAWPQAYPIWAHFAGLLYRAFMKMLSGRIEAGKPMNIGNLRLTLMCKSKKIMQPRDLWPLAHRFPQCYVQRYSNLKK
jgi:hypothetical protein